LGGSYLGLSEQGVRGEEPSLGDLCLSVGYSTLKARVNSTEKVEGRGARRLGKTQQEAKKTIIESQIDRSLPLQCMGKKAKTGKRAYPTTSGLRKPRQRPASAGQEERPEKGRRGAKKIGDRRDAQCSERSGGRRS